MNKDKIKQHISHLESELVGITEHFGSTCYSAYIIEEKIEELKSYLKMAS